MSVRWIPVITAKVPGVRAYQSYQPTLDIDRGSAVNAGYWVESELDRLHAEGAKIIRVEMTGVET